MQENNRKTQHPGEVSDYKNTIVINQLFFFRVSHKKLWDEAGVENINNFSYDFCKMDIIH